MVMILVAFTDLSTSANDEQWSISAPNVDSEVVREQWLERINNARIEAWRTPYALDPSLNKTAQIWANSLRDRNTTQGTHIREDESFRDSEAIRRRFARQGVIPNLFTESNGRNVYRCERSDCTSALIDKIYTTYEFFASEKGRSYQPHRLSVVNSQYQRMGVGVAVGHGRYFLVMHVADRLTVNDPTMIFSDITNHRYRESIEYISRQGIVKWYDDGTFWPDRPINRAEIMKIIVEASVGSGSIGDEKECFRDVRNERFAQYICYAKRAWLVRWYDDGNFKPYQSVSIAEALKMWLESFNTGVEENSGSGRYQPYFDRVYAYELFPRNTLLPNKNMTRGQMAYLTHQLIIRGQSN